MNLALLKKLVRILEKSGVDEIEVEEEGLRVRLAKNSRAQAQGPSGHTVSIADFPVTHLPEVHAPPPAAASSQQPPASNVHEVRSPIVGTFYRAPAPDADSYVEVGEIVQPKAVVCIIEAMKLMNEIETEVGGRVVKILVENGQPVEYNQVLFHIEPA
jgi:acetyl-CoA carboxylase biotin carboxyl carrier protein